MDSTNNLGGTEGPHCLNMELPGHTARTTYASITRYTMHIRSDPHFYGSVPACPLLFHLTRLLGAYTTRAATDRI